MPIPLRKYTHEQRLSLARDISTRILSKYGDSILAVFVSGSTSKKLDRPYSDLEMISVVRDGVGIPLKYYLYKGIVVEIDYRQESDLLKAASRITINWPIEADQYRNKIILYERDGWSQKLDEASDVDQSGMREALRYATVELTEDLSVLHNAELMNDTVGIRSRGLYLAGDAAKVVLFMNQRYVVTTSWFWKQAFECPVKPEDFRKRVERMAGFVPTSPKEIVVAADELCDELFNMVRDQGISIESEELQV